MKILQQNLNNTCYDVITFLTQLGKSASNFLCNILISGKIIKEMPGSVASGTPCSYETGFKIKHKLPIIP